MTTAAIRRRTPVRVRALLLALALTAVTAAPARAEGENWAPLYNKLAEMLDERCRAVSMLFSRRIDPCATVTGTDLDAMRHCIIDLAKNHYVFYDPGFFSPDGADEIKPLIEETGALDGNGNPVLREPNIFTLAQLPNNNAFTRIPHSYGPVKYDNCFCHISYGSGWITGSSGYEVDSTPVLWEHFYEIYKTLLQFNYAIYNGSWIPVDGGMYTVWEQGSGGGDSWDLAKAALQTTTLTGNVSMPPQCVYRGNVMLIPLTPPVYGYMAYYQSVTYYYEIVAPLVNFYPIFTIGLVHSRAPAGAQWDDEGFPVRENKWTQWIGGDEEDPVFEDSPWSGTWWRTIDVLHQVGAGGTWCDAPLVGQPTGIGWESPDACVLMGWVFTAFKDVEPASIQPPSSPASDDRKDGLIQLCESCLYFCPRGGPIDPRDPFDGIEAKDQFGTSDATAGVKVAAYAAKLAGSQPCVSASLGSALPYGQKFAYSLDTRILSDSVVDGQRYVNLLRPRGRIVTFRFSSDTATTGNPAGVDQGQDYYLVRSNDGASYYLVFNDGGKSGFNSIHYYYQGNLSGVGIGPSPAATDTLWGTAPWPGLEPVYEAIAGTYCQRLKHLATAQKYNTLLYDGSGRYTGAQAFELDFDANGDPIPGAALAQGTYAYDAAGRLTQAENSVQGSLSSGVQVTYTDTANKAAYAYYGPAGAANPAKVVTLTQATSTDGVRTVTTCTGDRDKDAQGAVIASVSSVSWQTFPWGEEKVAETSYDPANPGPADAPTLYTYHTDAANDGDNYGRLKFVVNPDQSWARYTYDAQGRTLSETTPFLNAAPDAAAGNCKVVAYSYTPASDSNDDGTRSLNAPRLTVTTLCGQEVGRSWRVEQAGATLDIRCAAAGAAWDAAGNQVTVTERFTSGAWQGRASRVVRPDGTVTLYSYAMDNGDLVTTVSTGAPATDGQSVIDGVRSVTRMDAAGRELFSGAYDIASNLLLSSSTQSAFDEFGRVTQTDYSDGTSSETVYGCCGPDTVTGRDGIATSYVYDDLQQVVSETRAGLATAYTRDLAGNTTSTTRLGSDNSAILQSTGTYDSAGRLAASADALGNVTTYAETLNHDGNGNLDGTRTKTITNPDGTTQIETSNRDGSPATVTGTAVHPMKYEYGVDANNGPYTKTIRVGANNAETEWTTSYTDFLGRGYKTVTAGGAVSQTFYNALGQQIKAVDPDGVTALYAYNARGEQEYAATDMNGNDQIDFAGPDRITRTQSAVLTAHGTTVRRTTTTAWTGSGANDTVVVAETDASVDGTQTWQSTHGLTTHSVSVTIPATRTKTTTVTAPDGSTTVSVSQDGRQQNVTRCGSDSARISQTTYAYDAHGRPFSIISARGPGITFVYDAADRMIEQTQTGVGGLSQTTAYGYDNMNHQTTVTQPDSGEVHFTYWPTGELRKTWGARTYPAETTYDEQGRMKTLTTWQDYSGNGGTAVTTWVYNPVTGLLVQKLYADNQGPSYTYTLAGRKLTRTWARGVVTTYAYNAAGEQSGVTYSDGTPGAAYQFDRAGRQQSVTDATGATTFTYAALGERLGEAHAGGLLDNVAIAYAYDTLRRPQQLTATIGTATVQTSYTYDAASRLASVSNGAHSAAYGYLSDSNLVGTVTFSGSAGTVMTTTKSYDGLNRLTAIATASGTPATTKTRYDYLYNTANQRIRATLADGSYWVYQYDALGQVVSGRKFNAADAPVPGMGFGYAFDDIGNRKQASSLAVNGQPAAQSDYTANLLNQYTARTVPGVFDLRGDANPAATVTVTSPADAILPSAIHATARQGAWWHAAVPVSNTAASVRQNAKVTGVLKGQGADGKDVVAEQTLGSFFVPQTPETFTYDADGNLTVDGRWSYTWDGENRLIAMTPLGSPAAGAVRLEYVYDANGRRTAKKVYAWATDQWQLTKDTRFLYDGWNLLAELSFDVGSLTLNVERSYAWGLDLSGSLQGAGGVGGLLFATSHTSPPATQCYAYDGNGNVVALISAASGAESAHYEYDPFGNILVSNGTGASANHFRFSTKFHDIDNDLLYYGIRYYSPIKTRWINRDPIEESGGVNVYSFTLNDPIGKIDKIGNNVYIAYRELVGYGSLFSIIGHVYLAFDNENMGQEDETMWYYTLYGHGYNKQAWHTFSFHPDSVRTNAGNGNLVGIIYTNSSWVDVDNFSRDIDPITQGSAHRILVTKDPCEQTKIFKAAHRSALINRNGGHDRGNYSLFINDCGTWAQSIVNEAGVKWPTEAYLLNLGTGLGGFTDFTLLPQLTYGLSVVGYNTVNWVLTNGEVGPLRMGKIENVSGIGAGEQVLWGWRVEF